MAQVAGRVRDAMCGAQTRRLPAPDNQHGAMVRARPQAVVGACCKAGRAGRLPWRATLRMADLAVEVSLIAVFLLVPVSNGDRRGTLPS